MSSFWRLLGYLRNYRLLVSLNVLSNILTAVFTVVSIPLLIPFLEVLFERAYPNPDPVSFGLSAEQIRAYFYYRFSLLIQEQGKEYALSIICISIVVTFFLKNLFRYLSLFFMAPVRNGVIRDIRSQIFNKLLELPISYFSEEKKGDLISRITGDVQEVEWSILNVLESVFREPLIIIGSLGLMVYISPQLTLFVLLLIFFTAFVIGGIGKTLKKPSALVQHKLGILVSIVEEALSGLRIIKGFNAENYQNNKFQAENNDYRKTLTGLLWRRELSSPLSEFLGIGVVSVLLWYGSRQVFADGLAAETFLAFIYAFYSVIDPSKSLSKAYYNIQKGIAALNRVEHILDTQNPIHDPQSPLPAPVFSEAITYNKVNFYYRNADEPVLTDIDLHIPKGKVVALVGASGAGKSTLVDLLPRFYDVRSGSILIDGQDIRQYKLKDLRSLMGIVSQEAILFNDTIYNNIVFGLPNVSPAEVEQAARIAHAHEFILATEKGYQTNIGDRGNKLSGGQRQRLTIARAILKNPPILILDEATSALDSESEKLVQEALVHLMKNRTSIIIAHRLSTIQHADEIVVMKNGRIIERGTHRELLHNPSGEYHKLVELQAF
jgi:ABC-type multidrug transport system fused ATPase/permease subunit